MATKKRYIVTHGNYTVKKTHKKLDGEKTVYERDYTVLNNTANWDNGVLGNGTSSFKFVTNTKINNSKKYKYGDWLKSEDSNDEVWTLDGFSSPDSITDEYRPIISQKTTSLLDFAYYGSCSELIKTTITNIIETFPGELYVTNNYYSEFIYDSKGNIVLDDESGTPKIEVKNGLYEVFNPFSIDIVSLGLPTLNRENINKMRYFCESYFKYEILDANSEYISCIDTWDVGKHDRKACFKNGDFVCRVVLNNNTLCIGGQSKTLFFDVYFFDGDYKYYSNIPNIRIRPNVSYIEKYFKSLDDFSKLLLNRYSAPIYTVELDFPHETDNGVATYKRNFTWPITYDYNLDFNGTNYKKYINALLELADFYDNRQTNNLYRAMVHDAIKNMDLTFIGSNKQDTNDDYAEGASKMEGLLLSYGRQFDELKRYIDNIKYINQITYDGNNNISPYFLSDKLETSGWEIVNTSPSKNSDSSISNLYPGDRRPYTNSDANITFLRNLLLNTKSILSKKGTRNGIESLLSLFGLKSYDFVKSYYEENPNFLSRMPYDYKITEYVNIVNGTPNIEKVERYNALKDNFVYENDENEIDTNFLQGLPVREVVYGREVDGNIVEERYLIPWFSKKDNIDGNPYFQMYGGWGKMPKKDITNDTISELVSNGTNQIYDETCKYVNIAKRINDLKSAPSTLKSGDIYYISDISDFDEVYKGGLITLNGDNNTKKASNYFILKDINYASTIGSVIDTNNNIKTGWENIPEMDIKNATNDGFKVLYVESIIDEHKGNNPHCGFGRYDDGSEFLSYFKTLFKNAISLKNFSEMAYDCEKGDLIDEIPGLGFSGLFDEQGNVINIVDNVKTWYFTDTINDNRLYLLEDNSIKQSEIGVSEIYGSRTSASTVSETSYEVIGLQDFVKIGKNNNFTFFNSEATPYNFEGKEDYEEAAANSIINNKKLLIEFTPNIVYDSESYNYLNNCILPFLKQMVPSTTILEIGIEGSADGYTCIGNIAQVEGLS